MQIPVIYDSPGVGQNLQDHVYSSGFVWVTSLPVSLIRNRIDTMSFLPKYAFEWLFYGIGKYHSHFIHNN